MIKRALTISLVLLPVVILWEGAPFGQALQPRPVENETTGSFYLPTVTLDLSDLDARDSQNRPLSPALQQDLTVLFIHNLFTLLLTQDPHAIFEIRQAIEDYLHCLLKG